MFSDIVSSAWLMFAAIRADIQPSDGFLAFPHLSQIVFLLLEWHVSVEFRRVPCCVFDLPPIKFTSCWLQGSVA